MLLPNIIDTGLDVILKRLAADLREQYAAVHWDETPEQTEARLFILHGLTVMADYAYKKEI